LDSAHDSQPEARGEPGTLGELLYSHKARPTLDEKDWVCLLQSIAAGDQNALHALYQRTQRIVFTLALRITNNRQTAEEVTVDVFHDVWRRASTYDPANGTVVGWIMNQARSRAIDRLRFEQRKKRADPHSDTELPLLMEESPEEVVARGERADLLRHALTTLTPEERRAIETAFFSELTYYEVAARLKEPLGTVKTRIRCGLAKLRQTLAKTRKDS
jgi:RNA polymerase sigma-70 factor (ECF subfamily)